MRDGSIATSTQSWLKEGLMPTATREVERIVRKVLAEQQDDTADAIEALSSLLTEQVIPRLSDASEEEPEAEPDEAVNDEDQDDVVPMSAYGSQRAGARPHKRPVNGRGESEDPDSEDQEVPAAVTDAFADFYHALSPEQAATMAALFTAIESELDEHGEEVRARA
jgi:hypothetical protein